MSVRVLSWVLDNSNAPGNDRLVLIAIADEADDDGTNAYPSMDRISRRARVNKRTTMRAIERLEEAGELVVLRPKTSGRGHFNRYGITMGRPPGVVLALVENPGKGDTLAPARKGAEGRVSARKGAPMSAPDPQTPRPVNPKDKDSAVPAPPDLQLVAQEPKDATTGQRASVILAGYIDWCGAHDRPKPARSGQAAQAIRLVLEAGWTDKQVKKAMIEAPTITTNALEMALSKGGGKPTGARAPVDEAWDRSRPSGEVRL